jgi:hypothetical protein
MGVIALVLLFSPFVKLAMIAVTKAKTGLRVKATQSGITTLPRNGKSD